MTKLSSFRRDATAMQFGEWVSPGAEYGTLELKCRFLGYAYADAVAAKTKAAARLAGGEDKLSTEQRSRINIDALIETALIDVRGLEDDATGQPVTVDAFAELLRDPGYGELASLAFRCCMQVGRQRQTEKETAAGN